MNNNHLFRDIDQKHERFSRKLAHYTNHLSFLTRCIKVIFHFCIAYPFCAKFMASFSVPSCKRILNTWRICRLYIELCQLKNGYSSPTSGGTPPFFTSHCNQFIISFACEKKTNLISIAENWIKKENSRYTVFFSIFAVWKPCQEIWRKF